MPLLLVLVIVLEGKRQTRDGKPSGRVNLAGAGMLEVQGLLEAGPTSGDSCSARQGTRGVGRGTGRVRRRSRKRPNSAEALFGNRREVAGCPRE